MILKFTSIPPILRESGQLGIFCEWAGRGPYCHDSASGRMPMNSQLTREMQTEINYYFVENLEGIESKDWYRFGKVRIAREHYLNPERPALAKRKK